MQASVAENMSALKRKIAAIEGRRPFEEACALRLGIKVVDATLGGGLARGALHELEPRGSIHCGAASGFALACAALAARHGDDVLWIESHFAVAETGKPYGLGLEAFGFSLARVLIVRVARSIDVLWVMEEALRCRGIAAVIAQLTEVPDLTATRRLALAVRDGGGLGFLVRHRVSPHASAALTRWQIAAARSRSDAFGGLGRAAFDLELTKNRHGPLGRWTILWDHHDRAFLDPALSLAVARAPCDRSDRALRRAG